ncbi:MAG: NAD(P)-dependent alcohol dehydrogenase [Anaerolineaceae bacterium]|nr:NAD(P)-dependent alcohol dehydrogenase [Anaerolineaceae bacterium]MCB9099319.1 NAD(P)-dependent alcohol dehydrogenase [Anaerolineales bacterium]
MKVIQIQDNWSIDNLTLTERPDPEPGPGQVLLRMKAASLNYRDLVVPRRGYGRLTGELPLIPISDGVGEVVALGEGVRRVKVGDRVCPTFLQSWMSGEATMERLTGSLGGPLDGVMAEYMVLSEQGVVKVPAHLTDEQAATLPCAALTAWSAIVTEGRVKAGDKVLVQGTGGVSLFALQFAKLQGAHVIVTSSRDEKVQRALDLGADEGINYVSTPEWGKAAKALAGGDGVDHIIEVGGTETLPQSLRAIRAGGTISLIGVLSGLNMNASLGPIVTRQVRLQGISCGNRDGFEAMVRAIGQHAVQPVVDRVFAFEDLRPALDYLARSGHFGKICIRH